MLLHCSGAFSLLCWINARSSGAAFAVAALALALTVTGLKLLHACRPIKHTERTVSGAP